MMKPKKIFFHLISRNIVGW